MNGRLRDDPFHEILILKSGSVVEKASPRIQNDTPKEGQFSEQNDDRDGNGDYLDNMLGASWSVRSRNSTPSDGPESTVTAHDVYQLVDSSTPTGGFAHSNTIEVAWQFNVYKVETFPSYCWDVLLQTISATIPYVHGACSLYFSRTSNGNDHSFSGTDCETGMNDKLDGSSCFDEWLRMDKHLSSTTTSQVSRRASCMQGSGWIRAATHCFPATRDSLKKLRQLAAKTDGGHAATCFGAICGMLGVSPNQATSMFLYCTVRDMVNAGVRMNLIGPLEGCALIRTLCRAVENVLQNRAVVHWTDAHQVAPIVEVLANAHERLYTRLFNS